MKNENDAIDIDEDEDEPQRVRMHLFEADLIRVRDVAVAAGEDAKRILAKLYEGTTPEEFAELLRDLETKALKRRAALEGVLAEPRSGKYLTLSALQRGQSRVSPGTVVELSAEEARVLLGQAAIEPIV